MRAVLALAIALMVAGCLDLAGGPRDRSRQSFGTGFEALSGDRTDRVIVEVHYAEGHVPYPAALATLQEEMGRALPGKSIEVLPPTAIPPTGKAEHTVQDLQDLHMRTFTLGPAAAHGDARQHVAWLHVVYVDGKYASPDGIEAAGLQLTWSGVVFLFPDTIAVIAGLPQEAWQVLEVNHGAVERAVLVHEAGHAMGLVDCGVPMVEPHADPESPCHSSDPDSVMRSGVGGLQGWMELLQDNTWVPYRYTEQDLADLAAYRAA
jgi:hypothetical protein